MFENLSIEMLFLGFIVVSLIAVWLYMDILRNPDKEARWLLEGSKHCWPGVKDEELEFKKIKRQIVPFYWFAFLFFLIYGLLIVITLVRRILGI